MLVASGEVGEEWVIVKLNGFKVVEPVPPIVSLLCSGSVGDCIEVGKLSSQEVIFDLTLGGRGQILKSFGTCEGMFERSKETMLLSDR
jgi:hypothetical protein